MSQLWQLKALMKKNYILMKRSCCASLCEIFFPIFLMIMISLVRRAIKIKEYQFDGNEIEFLKSNSTALIGLQEIKNIKIESSEKNFILNWNDMGFYYPL
jgi:hypothetical protein